MVEPNENATNSPKAESAYKNIESWFEAEGVKIKMIEKAGAARIYHLESGAKVKLSELKGSFQTLSLWVEGTLDWDFITLLLLEVKPKKFVYNSELTTIKD